MTYFTSDQHFGHENIIRFCQRPFRGAAEMTEFRDDYASSGLADTTEFFCAEA